MADFPVLNTKAVAQYPSERHVTFRTVVNRFVDGSEHRYPQIGSPHLRWVVNLNLLTDDEAQRLMQFYLLQQGQQGTFSFQDPWTGTEYPHCSFENENVSAELRGEAQSRLQFVIRSNAR